MANAAIDNAIAELGHKLRILPALTELAEAARAAEAKHGDQDHLPDGTGPLTDPLGYWEPASTFIGMDRSADVIADKLRARCDKRARAGTVAWADILFEEIAEAFAEDDPARLRAELLDAGAVIVRWIIALDAR